MSRLRQIDPGLAFRIGERASAVVARIEPEFPGDPATGILGSNKGELARFFRRFDGVACPALNLETGSCEIYPYRPVACRVAGPPVRIGGEAMPHCRLCFDGESEKEIEAARVEVDPGNFEISLLAEYGLAQTLIAYALRPGQTGKPQP